MLHFRKFEYMHPTCLIYKCYCFKKTPRILFKTFKSLIFLCFTQLLFPCEYFHNYRIIEGLKYTIQIFISNELTVIFCF